MKTRKPAPVKVDVRMPMELRERLNACAARDHRSINQQAVFYIEKGMEAVESTEDRLSEIEKQLERLLRLVEEK